ncbi:zinc-dependent metalloprotease, partial [Fusicatenibacter saccharivorans]|nr:zinc-dependent metalloprotease [Fusicatenibacter saccharivorans]
PEQREALASLESLLAMVEGWVDCVVWRAGMAHLPHIEQLREMMRRERAMVAPAALNFESLLGLQLRSTPMREA